MSLLDALRHRWRTWTHRADYERDLDEEMRFHLTLDGEHRDSASARRRFGNLTYMKEETRRAAGLAPLDRAVQDVRHLVRSLRRTPGFAVIAILTLALGIGVTTSVVSIVDHVVLHSLPFRDPDRLMMLLERGDRGGFRTPSAPTAADWKNDPGVREAFEGVAFERGEGVSLRVGDGVDRILVAYVSDDFFPLVGARPALGRLLTNDDHRRDAPPSIVLSYSLWRNTFGGDPSIVGRTISINDVPTTVVGVMPLGGTYPTFASAWQPVSHYANQDVLTRRGLHADSRTIGRLRPGVDSARAVALMKTVAARLAAAYPADQAHWSGAMLPLRSEILGGIEPTMYTLAAAAVVVLLLACANVANLLLARVASRGRELAVRSALGASRGRLLSQLLTESAVLATIGGALGTLFAVFAVRIARVELADRLPRADELAIDHRVLVVAVAASILTALLCGLWPALRASRPHGGETLRGGAHGAVGVRGEARMRRTLVVVQFGLALMLLVGAGLLMESFRRAISVNIGFDPRGLVAVRLNPPTGYETPDAAAALYARLMAAASTVPGVTDVAFIQHRPFASSGILTPVETNSSSQSDTASRQVYYRTASDTYLKTMNMSLVAGRWFDANDMRSPGNTFVVNETMAKAYWPGQNAVGQRITVHRSSQARKNFGEPLPGVVVGVVGDVHQVSQDQVPNPEVFVPYTLEPWPWGNIIVRARDATHVIPALRDAIAGVEPRLIPAGAKGNALFARMEDDVDAALQPRKLPLSLISIFAGCALLLAAIGMYGVVSFGITQRTRELGVRKALGATDEMIARLLLRESLWLAALGVVVGCFGAWAAGRLIRSQLFQTGIVDPLAYGATILLLVTIALIATWLPARRATRLDPTIAMRGE